MKKLPLAILLSVQIYAVCTTSQEKEAMRLWRSSIHQDISKKEDILHKADTICPHIPIIEVDLALIDAQKHIDKRHLIRVKNLNNALMVTPEQKEHRWNNNRKIDTLWIEYFKSLKSKKSTLASFKNIDKNIKILQKRGVIDKGNTKAILDIGGYYQADLLFDKNSALIKNTSLTKKIIAVIKKEINLGKNPLFGLNGGASSEGKATYNLKLSKQRAEALEKAILKSYPKAKRHLKVFANGESMLICEDDLLPEINSNGEYQCETQEYREKSRRVTIRRVR